ncbi:MAG: Holliday junction resolvase RuvX [Deltaproteobacteria bacterium]|jgi:putative Holliday junction resolvase|nr:Holliday junction resolvase RuvX [Deltaproteobacteria bacterium]MBW2535546.1 Holliday junction resolvase RuvX [Deltaproteobacteria bacterium]
MSASDRQREDPARQGRVAAIDLGKARVGVAVSDELGLCAHERPTLDGRNRRRLLESLRALAEQEGIVRFVVGWPLHMSGDAGRAADRAVSFAQQLADATGREVELCDERWTSVQAERELRAAGRRGRSSSGNVDARAAALILQQWLDARRPPSPSSPVGHDPGGEAGGGGVGGG